MEHGRYVFAHILPGCDVREAFIVALGLAVRGLMLLAEVPAAGFLAVQRVETHQLGKLEEVGNAIRFLERLIELRVAAGDRDVLPKLGANLREDRKSTRLNSSHSQISYAVFCLKKKKNRLLQTWE